MKRATLFLVAILCVLNASAQELDSLQFQSAPISIDSLSLRLTTLQHDYDIMYCDFEVHKLITELKDLSRSIDILSQGVLISCYHSKYDRELYAAYSDNYDSSRNLYASLKKKIEVVKLEVFLKMTTSHFSEREQEILYSSFGIIDSCTEKVEESLNYYNVVLKAYGSKR